MADRITELEGELEALRRQFELYFTGIEKRPPNPEREAYERRVRRTPVGNDAVSRFRMNNLNQRLLVLQNYWMRTIRAIEEGTYHRDLAKADRRFQEGKAAPPPTAEVAAVVAAKATATAKAVGDEASAFLAQLGLGPAPMRGAPVGMRGAPVESGRPPASSVPPGPSRAPTPSLPPARPQPPAASLPPARPQPPAASLPPARPQPPAASLPPAPRPAPPAAPPAPPAAPPPPALPMRGAPVAPAAPMRGAPVAPAAPMRGAPVAPAAPMRGAPVATNTSRPPPPPLPLRGRPVGQPDE
jgi:hypothetical protein